MQITFKLYAGLTDYLPPEHRQGNLMTLDVPADATIAGIVEPFRMPPKLVHVVLVNGHLEPEHVAVLRNLAVDRPEGGRGVAPFAGGEDQETGDQEEG